MCVEKTKRSTGRFDLSEKVIWVVGGGGYLGRQVCLGLADHGAHVVVADRSQSHANAVVELIRQSGGLAEAAIVDAGDESSIETAARKIIDTHGQFDVMVNMTFSSTGKPMMEMSADDFSRGLNVSLTGAFVLARVAGAQMVKQGYGSIIQFSSMYGIVSPDPSMYPSSEQCNPVDYGAAKAGVLQLVRYMAVQLAPAGVRVNAIVPGTFPDTETLGYTQAFLAKLKDKIPMRRVGHPKEIAGPVIFLASEASSYVTGTALVVDGGWTAW